jgi:hypothetical protein
MADNLVLTAQTRCVHHGGHCEDGGSLIVEKLVGDAGFDGGDLGQSRDLFQSGRGKGGFEFEETSVSSLALDPASSGFDQLVDPVGGGTREKADFNGHRFGGTVWGLCPGGLNRLWGLAQLGGYFAESQLGFDGDDFREILYLRDGLFGHADQQDTGRQAFDGLDSQALERLADLPEVRGPEGDAKCEPFRGLRGCLARFQIRERLFEFLTGGPGGGIGGLPRGR